MDNFQDRIFTPYISGVIIKVFEESTGIKVSEFGEKQLKHFIDHWSKCRLRENETG